MVRTPVDAPDLPSGAAPFTQLSGTLAQPPPQVPRVQAQAPGQNVQALLDHIETSGDPIFWG
jgi:hypothetical protein